MCEAEFPDLPKMEQHENLVHGTGRWYRSSCAGLIEVEPYVVSPAEKRATVERFAYAQQHSSETHINMDPSGLADAVLPGEVQRVSFWAELFTCFVAAHCVNVGHENLDESLAQELYRVKLCLDLTDNSSWIYRTLFGFDPWFEAQMVKLCSDL